MKPSMFRISNGLLTIDRGGEFIFQFYWPSFSSVRVIGGGWKFFGQIDTKASIVWTPKSRQIGFAVFGFGLGLSFEKEGSFALTPTPKYPIVSP